MLSLLCPLFLGLDALNQRLPRTPEEFDKHSLDRFFMICVAPELHYAKLIDRYEDAAVHCTWNGVQCTDGRVEKISLIGKERRLQFINPSFLPASLKHVHVDGQHSMRLITRHLPPHLEDFVMMHCNMLGSVAFRALPRQLHIFNAMDNRLRGTLMLTEAPPQLRQCSLQQNFFSMLIIDNAAFCEDACFDFREQSANGMEVLLMPGSAKPRTMHLSAGVEVQCI